MIIFLFSAKSSAEMITKLFHAHFVVIFFMIYKSTIINILISVI